MEIRCRACFAGLTQVSRVKNLLVFDEQLLHKTVRLLASSTQSYHCISNLPPVPLHSTIPENKTAWTALPGAHPFVVKEAPYPTAGPGEVVIKNAAVALYAITHLRENSAQVLHA
jgi:hypothetical protein